MSFHSESATFDWRMSPIAWGNLGNVLKNQGKMAEAEKAYRNALHHRGNMADMLYNLWVLKMTVPSHLLLVFAKSWHKFLPSITWDRKQQNKKGGMIERLTDRKKESQETEMKIDQEERSRRDTKLSVMQECD